MTVGPLPELVEFERRIGALASDPRIARVTSPEGFLALRGLTLEDVTQLLAVEEGYYFLLAATQLNRTTLRQATRDDEALIVAPRQRKAYAVRDRLPVHTDFQSVTANAVTLRRGDLQRKARGHTEQHFRDRLIAEGIPLLMSPPRRVVPGAVIAGRKPDGVWPDPATGAPPVLYLEIKRIRRVADDIQKRLYELAEASLEMKLLYGSAEWRGLGITDNTAVGQPGTAQRLRDQVTGRAPHVVGLLLCPRAEAEKYRRGAEALIDRIFFQEEVDDCIDFIERTIEAYALS